MTENSVNKKENNISPLKVNCSLCLPEAGIDQGNLKEQFKLLTVYINMYKFLLRRS